MSPKLPLKLYAISFIGYSPVGAVAVVQARTKIEAVIAFKAQLAIEERFLVKDNKCISCEDITELTFTSNSCHILLNGQY